MAYRDARTAAGSAAARADARDAFEHAVGLGGGLESRLGFAASSLLAGRGGEGAVLAAATKAADQPPASAAGQNALGLALEARGDYRRAAAAYRAALAVLRHTADANVPGVAATGGLLLDTFLRVDASVQVQVASGT